MIFWSWRQSTVDDPRQASPKKRNAVRLPTGGKISICAGMQLLRKQGSTPLFQRHFFFFQKNTNIPFTDSGDHFCDES